MILFTAGYCHRGAIVLPHCSQCLLLCAFGKTSGSSALPRQQKKKNLSVLQTQQAERERQFASSQLLSQHPQVMTRESMNTGHPSWVLAAELLDGRPLFFFCKPLGRKSGAAIFHCLLLGLIHCFALFSQMALELKTLTVPNTSNDLPDLLPLQFYLLIFLPRPRLHTLIMRKWAVVFVYRACLSGCGSSAAF